MAIDYSKYSAINAVLENAGTNISSSGLTEEQYAAALKEEFLAGMNKAYGFVHPTSIVTGVPDLENPENLKEFITDLEVAAAGQGRVADGLKDLIDGVDTELLKSQTLELINPAPAAPAAAPPAASATPATPPAEPAPVSVADTLSGIEPTIAHAVRDVHGGRSHGDKEVTEPLTDDLLRKQASGDLKNASINAPTVSYQKEIVEVIPPAGPGGMPFIKNTGEFETIEGPLTTELLADIKSGAIQDATITNTDGGEFVIAKGNVLSTPDTATTENVVVAEEPASPGGTTAPAETHAAVDTSQYNEILKLLENSGVQLPSSELPPAEYHEALRTTLDFTLSPILDDAIFKNNRPDLSTPQGVETFAQGLVARVEQENDAISAGIEQAMNGVDPAALMEQTVQLYNPLSGASPAGPSPSESTHAAAEAAIAKINKAQGVDTSGPQATAASSEPDTSAGNTPDPITPQYNVKATGADAYADPNVLHNMSPGAPYDPRVLELQTMIKAYAEQHPEAGIDLGEFGDNGDGLDGKFGDYTEASVKAVQRDLGFDVNEIDGQVELNSDDPDSFYNKLQDALQEPDDPSMVVDKNLVAMNTPAGMVEDLIAEVTGQKEPDPEEESLKGQGPLIGTPGGP